MPHHRLLVQRPVKLLLLVPLGRKTLSCRRLGVQLYRADLLWSLRSDEHP